MEGSRIPPVRPDVVGVESTPRPTPTPARVHFSEVLAGGARAVVRGAEAAVRTLPGAPLVAVAIRGGGSTVPVTYPAAGVGTGIGPGGGVAPEGPGGNSGGGIGVGSGAGAPGTPGDGGLEGSLAQAQEMNLYYLRIQEEVNAQNRTYTALSNILKAEHDTAKSAIGNIH